MLSEEARRLEQARQMGFSCDIEGLARDPRLDTYTEELLWDRSLTPAQRDRLLFRKIKELYPSQDVELSKTQGLVSNERPLEGPLPHVLLQLKCPL
jgi:hypothetical protein